MTSAGDRGACYFALEELGAWVEVFRKSMTLDVADVDGRRMFSTALGRDLRLADVTSRAALQHGVTASIGADSSYSESQRFAAEADLAGFDGIRYYVRHDPSQSFIGVALFGNAGDQTSAPDWPDGTDRAMSDRLRVRAADEFNYKILRRP